MSQDCPEKPVPISNITEDCLTSEGALAITDQCHDQLQTLAESVIQEKKICEERAKDKKAGEFDWGEIVRSQDLGSRVLEMQNLVQGKPPYGRVRLPTYNQKKFREYLEEQNTAGKPLRKFVTVIEAEEAVAKGELVQLPEFSKFYRLRSVGITGQTAKRPVSEKRGYKAWSNARAESSNFSS